MKNISNKRKWFCVTRKHWCTPVNRTMQSKKPAINIWHMDDEELNMCMYHSKERNVLASCTHFVGKI